MAASSYSSAVQKKLEDLPSMVAGVWSADRELQLDSTTQIRKLLADQVPPCDEVVETGVVPRLLEFLGREWDNFSQLQFEAAWALTNITSGSSENTKAVVDHGAVPLCVRLLGSPSYDVREQVLWVIANVAGDTNRCRDLVLSNGALPPLLAQLNEHAKLSMVRTATWALGNLCRWKPEPPFDQVKPALPAIAHLIHHKDEEVLTDACWALSYLSAGSSDKVQAVIEAGVCPRLVELLMYPSPYILSPALKTIANIVAGDEMQTQCLINDHQALPCLLKLLASDYTDVINREACRTISSITARSQQQIQSVIEANIIGPLLHLLQDAKSIETKKEAALAVSNVACGGNHDQIKYLVGEGCIKPLCDLLVYSDPEIARVCLKSLEDILKVGESPDMTSGVNLYSQMIEDAKGLEKIENLLRHDNTEVSEKAAGILKTYWLEEEDETFSDVVVVRKFATLVLGS